MADPNFIRQTLEDLRARGLYRRLVALGPSPAVASGEGGSAAGPRVRIGGREVLQFASNNYLGLANDPRVKEALADIAKLENESKLERKKISITLVPKS